MNNSNGGLYFGSGIDLTQWRRDIAEMQRSISGLTTSVETNTSTMNNQFNGLKNTLGAVFAVTALKGFAQSIIDVRGEFQKTEIAFTTMLGSQDKAKDLMNQMVTLAAQTPFSLQDVSAGAKQLLAFQVPAEEVVDTLRRMGDISAGLGVPLSRINLVYGQVMAKGKLMGDDLRQFTEAGIPLVAELANKFGKTTQEVSQMVSAGKVGFKDVKDVLFSLTNQGGMFFNLMEKQSASVSGKIANVQDNIERALNEIGESNEGLIYSSIEGVSFLVENYKPLLTTIEALVVLYGSYRAALIVSAAAAQLATAREAGFTAAQIARLSVTGLLTTAQEALNATMLANPIVLITTAIAGLVFAYVKLHDSTTAQERSDNELSKIRSELSNKTNELKRSTDELVSTVRSETSTLNQQTAAYDKLKSAFPALLKNMSMQQFIAMSTLDVTRKLNAEMEKTEQIALSSQIQKKRAEIRDLEEKTTQMTKASAFNPLLNISTNQEKTNLEASKKALAELEKQQNNFNKTASAPKQLDVVKNKGFWEKAKKEAEETLAAMPDSERGNKQWNNLVSTIQNADKHIDSYSTTIKKKAVETKKAISDVASKDSIADLTKRLSLINSAIEKSSGNTVELRSVNKDGAEVKTGKITSRDNAIAQRDAISEAIRKKQIDNFEKELAEVERQEKVKALIQSKYGKEVADKQFKNNISSYEFLENKKKEYETKINSGVILSEQERQNIQGIISKIDELKGNRTKIELFSSDLKDQLANVGSLQEKLDLINSKKNNLSSEEVSAGYEKILADAENQLIEQQKESYRNSVQEYYSYEEKRKNIAEKYAEIRKQIEKDSTLNEETKSARKSNVDEAEKRDTSDLDMQVVKKSAEWQMAFGNLDGISNRYLQSILKKLRAVRDDKSLSLTVTDMAELSKAIARIENTTKQDPFSRISSGIREYFKAVKEIRQEREKADATIAQFGENSPEAIAAKKDLDEKTQEEEKKKAESRQKTALAFQDAKGMLQEAGSAAIDIGDNLFGGFNDATKDAIGNIVEVGSAAADLGSSIAKGDIGGMIKSGLKLISSLAKALNGDQKKERSIKQWANAVNKLKEAYQDLQRATDKSLGEDTYKQQQKQVQNLKEQQAMLQKMAITEGSKKKKDQSKIDEYNRQQKEINDAIEDIYENMADSISGTNAKDLASQLADALVEAYGKGEDAAKAYGKVADDVLKNAVKNALKKQILETQMDTIVKDLVKKMGFDEKGNGTFNGLTPQEQQEIKDQMKNASLAFTQALGVAGDLFKDSASDVASVEGAVKGVSEETASVLVGYLNAIRIAQAKAIDNSELNYKIMKDALIVLSLVENNTRPIMDMYLELRDLNSKIKKTDLLSSGIR